MINQKKINSNTHKNFLVNVFKKLTFSQKIAIFLLISVIIWISSGILFPHRSIEIKSSVTQIKRVTVEKIENQYHTPTLNVTGRTEAQKRVDVVALTAGTVEEIPIPKGSIVKEGDVIIRLASDGRASFVEEAKAMLAQKNAELAAQQKLFDQDFISRKTINEYITQAAMAKTNYERALAERDKASILAPFKGLLNDVPVDIAQSIRQGDKIFTLVQLDPLKIIGEVSEKSVVQLTSGQNIKVEMPDGTHANGKLSYVSRSAVGATRTFRVEGVVENSEHKIPEGASVNLSISLAQQMAAKIKRSALTLNESGVIGVRIVLPNSKAEFVAVTIIDDTQDELWVKGIPQNAMMITVGQDFVIDGETVNGIEINKASPTNLNAISNSGATTP